MKRESPYSWANSEVNESTTHLAFLGLALFVHPAWSKPTYHLGPGSSYIFKERVKEQNKTISLSLSLSVVYILLANSQRKK